MSNELLMMTMMAVGLFVGVDSIAATAVTAAASNRTASIIIDLIASTR